MRAMRPLREGGESVVLIASHPAIDALAGDAEGGCYFGRLEAISHDCEYGVVTLFHLGELHKHSATSCAPNRAEAGGKRLSSINRYSVTDHPLQSR
jgi:hypothetical protein